MKRNYCFSLVLFVALGTAMPVMADTLDESVYASQSIQQHYCPLKMDKFNN